MIPAKTPGSVKNAIKARNNIGRPVLLVDGD
jgi:hypothetical protein